MKCRHCINQGTNRTALGDHMCDVHYRWDCCDVELVANDEHEHSAVVVVWSIFGCLILIILGMMFGG